MKLTLATMFCAFLILATCSTAALGNDDKIFDSFGAIDCESEMAHLDNLAIELQNAAGARAYIFVYGGKRGTYRDEVRVRGARMKRYLIETRGVSPDRIEIIEGGYRESLAVEIWITLKDKPVPIDTPIVAPKLVRFKKGKMARYREPGCYPGKYLKAKSHASSHAGE